MYVYDPVDQQLVEQRVAQFSDQTRRFLDGQLTEDEFRVLRLQNGLYIQRHAPMLRVAIPYGILASRQLRTLAHIARKWDRGYGHFSTRQNIQFNWPKLEDVPEILAELATVQMHAIQTSGNCIRNTTTDHFAGIAPDELVNPLVWCEIIRQWSTLHPEFAFLPRKFKIAVSGAVQGPRRRRRARHRPAGGRARRQAGLSRLDRRRHGPHAHRRQADQPLRRMAGPADLPAGRAASTTCMAAVTTNTRRASRSWSRT